MAFNDDLSGSIEILDKNGVGSNFSFFVLLEGGRFINAVAVAPLKNRE